MKLKSLALASMAAFSIAAQAAPIALQPGPLYFQFNNLEQVGTGLNTNSYADVDLNGDGTADLTSATKEFNWGVFNVTSVQAGAVSNPHINIGGGPVYFSDDGPNGARGQITGIFYGFELLSATTLKGGYIDLWWTDAGSDTVTADDIAGSTYAPTARDGWNTAGKFTPVATGTFLARLKYMPGIENNTSTTVKSSLDPLSVGDDSGKADGYADVMDTNGDGVIDAGDGAYAAVLNTDWFFVDTNNNGTRGETGETRDLRFSNFFTELPSWNGAPGSNILGLQSNDPGRGFVVPEPTGLALVGLALVGLGLSRRRKAV